MKNLTKTFVAIALGATLATPALAVGGLSAEQIAEERANLHADGSLPFVHSAAFYGAGSREVIVTVEQQEELENLYADGSLPFIHSADIYGSSVDAGDAMWSAERIAEFENLRSDGSLL